MGSAKVYWTPQGSTAVQSIDLGTNVSLLTDVPTRSVLDALPSWGVPLRHDLGGSRTVVVEKRAITDAATIRALRSLTTHLQSGGSIAFCLDSDKLWGAWLDVSPTSGDTTLSHTSGSEFQSLELGSLAVGDEMTIESPAPELLREWVSVGATVATAATGTTLSGAVLQTMQTAPAFARYADFYPVLRLPAAQAAADLTPNDYRRHWTWRVELVEYPGDLAALYEGIQEAQAYDLAFGGAVTSLDDALASGLARVTGRDPVVRNPALAGNPRLPR